MHASGDFPPAISCLLFLNASKINPQLHLIYIQPHPRLSPYWLKIVLFLQETLGSQLSPFLACARLHLTRKANPHHKWQGFYFLSVTLSKGLHLNSIARQGSHICA